MKEKEKLHRSEEYERHDLRRTTSVPLFHPQPFYTFGSLTRKLEEINITSSDISERQHGVVTSVIFLSQKEVIVVWLGVLI